MKDLDKRRLQYEVGSVNDKLRIACTILKQIAKEFKNPNLDSGIRIYFTERTCILCKVVIKKKEDNPCENCPLNLCNNSSGGCLEFPIINEAYYVYTYENNKNTMLNHFLETSEFIIKELIPFIMNIKHNNNMEKVQKTLAKKYFIRGFEIRY